MLRTIVSRGHQQVSQLPWTDRWQSRRFAAQLYPTTSQRWDEALAGAELLVGDSSNFSNLQAWLSGEFNSITKYLQKLVGTNHPMLETAKRCTYISEGRMGSAQARGLTVILTAKAVEGLARQQMQDNNPTNYLQNLIKSQMSLAEMTEMTYSAYMIHRGVMELKLAGMEAVDFEEQRFSGSEAIEAKHAKGLHYGNKVSVLCGDFLLAYVMRGLGDLFSHRAVDLVASAITDFMEGEFLLVDDWRNRNFLLSESSRDLQRWYRRSNATIGSLQGNTCQAALVLAGIEGKLQLDAREFGRNLGIAWQAHTEIQPFLSDTYEPVELPEMPPYPSFDLNCLPVLLFLRDAYENSRSFNLVISQIKGSTFNATRNWELDLMTQHRHQEEADYERLHQLITKQGRAVERTYAIIKNYSQLALQHLDSFPPSEAKDVLGKICESLSK